MKCSNPECDNDIPAKSLANHKDQKYCSGECSRAVTNAQLKENGHYQKMSKAGNESQSRYKKEHGVVPGYENRVSALQNSNRINKRRGRQAD